MGLKDFAAKQIKKANRAGDLNGSSFPFGTFINMTSSEGEKAFLITYPNNDTEKITHDMIKCATVLAMGVVDIPESGRGQGKILYGTKYLMVLKDGRQGVITTGLGKVQAVIETVLF